MPIDPVCGMTVDESSPEKMERKGTTYYFCCDGCLDSFRKDPEKYLQKEKVADVTEVPKDAIYTCPMHPEIRQKGPGTCPKCGMALESVAITANEEENHELKDMTRRFWIGVILSAPVAYLGMMGKAVWLQFILATPVVLWGGFPFFQRAWLSVKHRSPNMFTLIAMGTGSAYFYSATVIWMGRRDLYFEAAAVITTLVLLGQVLELRARNRTSSAIKALLNLAPKTARRLKADG